MSFSDQIHGQRAPEYIQNFCARIGGKTPYGDPLYRVVRAESVFAKCFQQFTDWDENIAPENRGGIEMTENGWQERKLGRLRSVEELREVEVYPGLEGWIIERWYPATMLQWSRAEWERSPALGPYPERGVYVNVNTRPTRDVPTLKQVEDLINAAEYKIANKVGTAQQRIKDRECRILESIRKKLQAERERNLLKMRENRKIILGSSLAAGRVREILANRLRARGVKIGHVGN